MNFLNKLMAKLSFSNLINNNTGVSSKNFFLIIVTIIGTVLLCVVIAAIITDLINNGTVTMSWSDMGLFVGSISSMFCAVGITKAWSEKYERKPGPDGVLGTDDDVYIKKCSGYEYSENTNNTSEDSKNLNEPMGF